MNLKLTKKQEQALVNLGIETLLSRATEQKPKTSKKKKIAWNKGKTGRKWSKEQHAKYAATMTKKWGKLREKKP